MISCIHVLNNQLVSLNNKRNLIFEWWFIVFREIWVITWSSCHEKFSNSTQTLPGNEQDHENNWYNLRGLASEDDYNSLWVSWLIDWDSFSPKNSLRLVADSNTDEGGTPRISMIHDNWSASFSPGKRG